MEKKYQINTEENKKWLRELLDDILEFAKEGQAPDGSTYYQTDDGKPWLEKTEIHTRHAEWHIHTLLQKLWVMKVQKIRLLIL